MYKTCLIFLVKKTNTNDDALTMHYSTKRDNTQYVYLDSYLQIKALKKKTQLLANLTHLELYSLWMQQPAI